MPLAKSKLSQAANSTPSWSTRSMPPSTPAGSASAPSKSRCNRELASMSQWHSLLIALLTLVSCAAATSCAHEKLADAPMSPFTLDVVPSKSFGDTGSITMAYNMPRDFYVVLTNVSNEPQAVWESWNSWGYQTISFDLMTANGKKFVLSRGPEG